MQDELSEAEDMTHKQANQLYGRIMDVYLSLCKDIKQMEDEINTLIVQIA